MIIFGAMFLYCLSYKRCSIKVSCFTGQFLFWNIFLSSPFIIKSPDRIVLVEMKKCYIVRTE